MTYYDAFDCKINCEEVYAQDEAEIQGSQDFQSYQEWLDSLEPTEREAFLEQLAFEQKQARLKDRGNLNPPDKGDFYGGIAI